jgi:hypothetical protein
MLLVTNRPSVYVLIDGETVELEVDKPTEVSDFQGKSLIRRGVCLAVIEEKPKPKKVSKK